MNSSNRWRIILQKPKADIWGGDCGANERNVAVAITWTDPTIGNLTAYDVVRFILATATSSNEAIDYIGKLVATHGDSNTYFSLVICDTKMAWTISCAGKLWAAQCFQEGSHQLPSCGLAVSTTINRSSPNLGDSLKNLGCWNGQGVIDFAASFRRQSPCKTNWYGECSSMEEDSFSLTNMFKVLRSSSEEHPSSRASIVFMMRDGGISSYWFTATPNAMESVFKPFVFSPQPKISPLTKVPSHCQYTLLYKLHAQRKPTSVDHLKSLEASCVEEVSAYLTDYTEADGELDELMKDCVEAEVKFYR